MRMLRGVGLFLLLCLFSLPVLAQQPNIPGMDRPNITTFVIRGTVRDAATFQAIEDVRVDLRNPGGALVGSMVSGFSGDFEFDGLGSGEYFLVVQQPGYLPVNQEVQVNGMAIMGIQLELQRKQPEHAESPAATVSKRELSIPHKAHDAMMKGYRLLYQKSDAKGSLKEFEQATKAYPGYYEAYAQMGVAYMTLGDDAGAQKALRKSIDLSGGHYGMAYWMLAMNFSRSQRFADAEQAAQKAVALDQNSWQAQFELSRAQFGLKQFQDAEKSAAEVAKLNPDDAPVHLLLAKIHVNSHNYPAVLDDLNAYLKIEPKGPMADKVRTLRDKVQQSLASANAAPPAAKEPDPTLKR
jgi:Carboxypeptidase regulatory-like domain/Tetratricopeptide repeat